MQQCNVLKLGTPYKTAGQITCFSHVYICSCRHYSRDTLFTSSLPFMKSNDAHSWTAAGCQPLGPQSLFAKSTCKEEDTKVMNIYTIYLHLQPIWALLCVQMLKTIMVKYCRPHILFIKGKLKITHKATMLVRYTYVCVCEFVIEVTLSSFQQWKC